VPGKGSARRCKWLICKPREPPRPRARSPAKARRRRGAANSSRGVPDELAAQRGARRGSARRGTQAQDESCRPASVRSAARKRLGPHPAAAVPAELAARAERGAVEHRPGGAELRT
jgi:hypothetical protein